MLTGYQGPESCWDLGDVDRKCSLCSQSRESHLISLCDLHQGGAVDKPGASVLTGLNSYSSKKLCTWLSSHCSADTSSCLMAVRYHFSSGTAAAQRRFLFCQKDSDFWSKNVLVLSSEDLCQFWMPTLRWAFGWEDRARRWLGVDHLCLQCFRAESGSCTLLSPGRVCTEARNTGGGR